MEFVCNIMWPGVYNVSSMTRQLNGLPLDIEKKQYKFNSVVKNQIKTTYFVDVYYKFKTYGCRIYLHNQFLVENDLFTNYMYLFFKYKRLKKKTLVLSPLEYAAIALTIPF